MFRFSRVVRVGIVTAIALLLSLSPALVRAATAATLQSVSAPDIFITEVQTTNAAASEEFVELYNNTDNDTDFADLANGGKDPWKLQFFSSSSASSGTPDWAKPSASLSLSGVIPAHGYFLLSSSQVVNGVTTVYRPGGIDPDQTYTARLSDTGGGLQLVDVLSTSTTAHDRILWGQPLAGQLLPNNVLPTPVAGGSLQRLPDADTQYVLDDGSLAGFATEAQPTPKDAWVAPEPVATEPATDGTTPIGTQSGTVSDASDSGTPPTTPTQKAEQAEPVITELLPNPAAPQNDAQNEFIELYNPNDTSFDLTGYTLEAGSTTLHDFTFTEGATLPPHSYTAFFSSLTAVVLANGGSQARLLSPDKEVVSETAPYTTASEGQAWSWDGTSWQWTTTPTPGASNIFTLPSAAIPLLASAKISKAPASKSAPKVKGISTSKTTKSTTRKASAKSSKKPAKKSNSTSSQSGSAQDASQVTPIHPTTLAAVGMAAILYGVYEYRADIKNHFYQRTANRAARRAARQAA